MNCKRCGKRRSIDLGPFPADPHIGDDGEEYSGCRSEDIRSQTVREIAVWIASLKQDQLKDVSLLAGEIIKRFG